MVSCVLINCARIPSHLYSTATVPVSRSSAAFSDHGLASKNGSGLASSSSCVTGFLRRSNQDSSAINSPIKRSSITARSMAIARAIASCTKPLLTPTLKPPEESFKNKNASSRESDLSNDRSSVINSSGSFLDNSSWRARHPERTGSSVGETAS